MALSISFQHPWVWKALRVARRSITWRGVVCVCVCVYACCQVVVLAAAHLRLAFGIMGSLLFVHSTAVLYSCDHAHNPFAGSLVVVAVAAVGALVQWYWN